MLHLTHHRPLQADQIGGQCKVENLPAAIVEHLVAKGPPAQHGIKILAARALLKKTSADADAQFIDLEPAHERQFFGAKFAQAATAPKRALVAISILAVLTARRRPNNHL